MIERAIDFVRIEDPGEEESAATRERLKGRFPPTAVRRMTQLGMMLGTVLNDVAPDESTALIYASEFGESRALEAYLDSFPTPSPTLFQTSIHPSGAQQSLILRQQPWREFVPLAGGPGLGGQAVISALMNPAPRVVLCGGEERGTWLLPHAAASARSFAFAVSLSRSAGGVGRVCLLPTDEPAGVVSLATWFDAVRNRELLSAPVAPGWRLELTWR